MATLVATPKDIEATFAYKSPDEEPTDVYFKRIETELQKLQDASDALPVGQIVGYLAHFPRGDGHATYKVVKEKPLQVVHIPHGDAWHTDAITMRGLRASDIIQWQQQASTVKALKPMFSTKEPSNA